MRPKYYGPKRQGSKVRGRSKPIPTDEGRAALLSHKPAANRSKRPAWAMDDRTLWLQIAGTRLSERFQIARMYWRENKSAGQIAAELGKSRNSIKSILNRLIKK
jgi:hypothetical protein